MSDLGHEAFIVITDPDLKNKIMEHFREEQIARAKQATLQAVEEESR